jgi:parvulin-like peptidyl-prolyl isomerase
MVQKLHEAVAGQVTSPTDDEIRAFIDRSREGAVPDKRVRLRSLRFESAEDATRSAERIRRGRMTFADAVVAYETDPGQGVLLEFSWNGLSEELRAALSELKPGQVSRPVEFNGDPFLFYLEAWVTGQSELDAELARRARGELERERRREARDGLLRELRGRTPVRIHDEGLPFRYVPDPEA